MCALLQLPSCGWLGAWGLQCASWAGGDSRQQQRRRRL